MANQSLNGASSGFILLDAGNTRIKWLVADVTAHSFVDESRQFFSTSALEQPDGLQKLVQLLAQTATQFNCRDVWICHVLGAGFFKQLATALKELNLGLTLRAPVVGGSKKLKTMYVESTRLGQDRWIACLALLDLPIRVAHDQTQLNCIVSFGTATTIDAVVKGPDVERLVDPDKASKHPWMGHVHLGGVIIPGMDLMSESLHRNTAQLPKASIQYQRWPTSTHSAIASGIIRTQWSAVRSFVHDLEAQFGSDRCQLWVHGGHAEALLPYVPVDLSSKMNRLQDAVFHGLMYSIQESSQ